MLKHPTCKRRDDVMNSSVLNNLIDIGHEITAVNFKNSTVYKSAFLLVFILIYALEVFY
jgi:hypothetical protein